MTLPPRTTHHAPRVTTDELLTAYANGYFPMALNRDDPEIYWFSPEERGVIPLETFHTPASLKKFMRTAPYRVTVDQAFEQVIRACGTATPTRRETWINETIEQLYTELFRIGHAHSVEVWEKEDPAFGIQDSEGAVRSAKREPLAAGVSGDSREGGVSPPSEKKLIGGLYGVSIGGAFFGESMFSRAPNASKIALVQLVGVLREASYSLLDAQYVNAHLKQFGIEAWPKERYMTKLENALSASPNPSTRFSTASVRKGLASASSINTTFSSR